MKHTTQQGSLYAVERVLVLDFIFQFRSWFDGAGEVDQKFEKPLMVMGRGMLNLKQALTITDDF